MKKITTRRAFTLIELLIVIAIIGILFIVLVSKVDFATDKAKTSGVQTDFRSFQMAFETVAKEHAGFNTFGWDPGDTQRADFEIMFPGYTYENADKDAGDRIRNSYDKGDKNFNGICDNDEVWTGEKVYTENWMGIFTLKNPVDESDTSAYIQLENAINKHLDPKMHITIDPDTHKITMANGYQDPWKTQYHGMYDTNTVDGLDRGVILMYSNGANQKFGSEYAISNGILSIIVPDNNINGADDLVIATYYTYTNGFGEVKTKTEFDTVIDTSVSIVNVLDTSMWKTGFVTDAGILYSEIDTLVYSKRIPVRAGETYTLWSGTSSLWENSFRFVTAYDSEGNVLKNSGSHGGCHTYQVPVGVSSIVVSMSASQAPYSMIIKNYTEMPEEWIDYNGLEYLDNIWGNNHINVFNKNAATIGKYMGNNGGEGAANTLFYTEELSVQPNDIVYFWHGKSEYKPRFITAFDENGVVLTEKGTNSPMTTYIVPDGVSSIIVTAYVSMMDTFMIFVNNTNPPPLYIPFEEIVIPNDPTPPEIWQPIEYGPEYLTTYGDMDTTTKLSVGKADIITDKHLIFTSDVDSFAGIRLGHGYKNYTSAYVEIDNTSIKQYMYTSGTPTLLKSADHGLTITNDLKVTIDVNTRRVATVEITSNGQSFKFSSGTTWYGSNGEIYAESLGSVLPNAQLAWTCDGYSKDIWFFGDSYLSQSSDRWLYFAFNDGKTNALFDGYGGRGSGGAIASLLENLKHGTPKKVVWLMGMNDGSDPNINTPSTTWATNRDKLIELSQEYGFEIIFTTIPTVPNIYHEAKNKWIRESGYRYIDVAEGVGADSSGNWTTGYLASDNVHPTSSGAQAIYKKIKEDFVDFQ